LTQKEYWIAFVTSFKVEASSKGEAVYSALSLFANVVKDAKAFEDIYKVFVLEADEAKEFDEIFG